METPNAAMKHGQLMVDGTGYPLDRPETWPKELPLADELAAVVHAWRRNEPLEITTSGSTGAPKTIIHQLDNVVRSAAATAAYFVLPEGSNVLLCLPIGKIAGRMQVYRALINNWCLHAVPPSSIPLKNISGTLDFAAMTPHQAYTTLNERPQDFRKVRSVLLGGAPVSKPLAERLKLLGVQCWESYGMTETLTHVAVRKVSPEAEPFFRCLPGISTEVTADGALVLHGDRFPSPLITTDRVEWLDSRRFKWLGRTDFTLNTGGIKVQPEQVEAALEGVVDRTLIVTGEADDALGTRLVLLVEGEVLDSDEAARLNAAITERLQRYEQPKAIRNIDRLPRTENGKIERHKL